MTVTKTPSAETINKLYKSEFALRFTSKDGRSRRAPLASLEREKLAAGLK